MLPGQAIVFGTIHYETEGKSHRACVPTATPFRGQAFTFPARLADRQTRVLVLVNLIPTVKLGETKRSDGGVGGGPLASGGSSIQSPHRALKFRGDGFAILSTSAWMAF